MDKSTLTPDSKAPGRFTTSTEDIILSLCCLWIMVGLSIDGYAHANILEKGESESFFTPWHAIFYSGFAMTALWVGVLMYRRREVGKKVLEWIPEGYQFAFYGLIVFSIGGLGDAVWHTIFGIEFGVDALFSPTHLLLFMGIFMIASSPARAGWIRQGLRYSSQKASLPIHFSVGLIVSLVSFFMSYLWISVNPGLTQIDLFWERAPHSDINIPVENTGYYVGELAASLVLTGSLMTTVILLASVLYLWNRWNLRFGAAACIWGFSTLVAAGVFLIDKPTERYLIPAGIAFIGGLAFDVAIRLPYSRAIRGFLAATLAPLVMWSVWSICAVLLWETRWVAELWGGLLVTNVFVGLGVKFLMESGSPTSQQNIESVTVDLREGTEVPSERASSLVG